LVTGGTVARLAYLLLTLGQAAASHRSLQVIAAFVRTADDAAIVRVNAVRLTRPGAGGRSLDRLAIYSQSRRRNQRSIEVATTPHTIQNSGYAIGEAFSGIGMFIP
jgi:hypothetical protein